MSDMYEMNLNEVITCSIGYADVRRVPGGWIYTTYSENGAGGYDMSSCFVPLHDEFKQQT